jgi:tyrosyl-tRNA synthetase
MMPFIHRTFTSFEELIADYESGELHPADLKPAISKALNKILEVTFFHLFLINASLVN